MGVMGAQAGKHCPPSPSQVASSHQNVTQTSQACVWELSRTQANRDSPGYVVYCVGLCILGVCVSECVCSYQHLVCFAFVFGPGFVLFLFFWELTV